MVASVHPVQTLELFVELERVGYSRTIYFDTFPDSSGLDPQAETRTNILMVEQLRAIARQLVGDEELAAAIERHDATVSQQIIAMAGRVGDDIYGKALFDNLDRAGVDRSRVTVTAGQNSGMSVAIVTSEGDYGAVIVSAANLAIDAADIELPTTVRVVPLQNEMPEAATAALAEKARAAGAKIILNAAPARPFETAVRSNLDLLIVNRVEAAMICDRAIETTADAIVAAGSLAASDYGAIVTLGGEGAVLACADHEPRHFPALPVAIQSTHGAGDAFAGAMAARMALGADLQAALGYAQVAAAQHVARTPDQRKSITPEMVLVE